ncbi:MAG: hypothetical protein AAFR02_08395, partial [Pseudomonadota bacterium]
WIKFEKLKIKILNNKKFMVLRCAGPMRFDRLPLEKREEAQWREDQDGRKDWPKLPHLRQSILHRPVKAVGSTGR